MHVEQNYISSLRRVVRIDSNKSISLKWQVVAVEVCAGRLVAAPTCVFCVKGQARTRVSVGPSFPGVESVQEAAGKM